VIFKLDLDCTYFSFAGKRVCAVIAASRIIPPIMMKSLMFFNIETYIPLKHEFLKKILNIFCNKTPTIIHSQFRASGDYQIRILSSLLKR
jgi:hypothetical protein